MNRALILALLLLLAARGTPSAVGAQPSIQWREWSGSVFQQAKREHRFVLLDLEAVWCHWCHVMDEKTYSDPAVIALVNAHYIAVRVDQDSRPDLSNRYEDYGWPATVVFNADKGEIVKRQGFMPPTEMRSMLQAIVDDPSPGPSVRPDTAVLYPPDGPVSPQTMAALRNKLDAGYDSKLGAWEGPHKFLDWDNVEFCMERAQAGDTAAGNMARQTLDAQLQLIDPVWGGVDQYSAEGDWTHPHYEKIMQMQAEDIRIYALAAAQWNAPEYLRAAMNIHRYVTTFLRSPEGAFYTSQDADLAPGSDSDAYYRLDDAERRKLGIPRIDKHIYARENGWFIEALVQLYATTGDEKYLREAETAAGFILGARSLQGGGFAHGAGKAEPVCLGDTLYMGRAFLSLYEATGDRNWLTKAVDAAGFIDSHFSAPNGAGFNTAESGTGLLPPKPEFDENVDLACFANLLAHCAAEPKARAIAARALRFVSAPEIADRRRSYVGGLLLAAAEFSAPPLHIAIVARKDDPAAHQLFMAALAYPRPYKQLERVIPGAAGAGSIAYPTLASPAAFICTETTCSAPIFKPDAIAPKIARLSAKQPL